MKITQEVREFAAKQNADADAFIAAEEGEAGMAEMSERLRRREGKSTLPWIDLERVYQEYWQNHEDNSEAPGRVS